MAAPPPDPWDKAWALGACGCTVLTLALTLYSVFTTNGNWLSTSLHVSCRELAELFVFPARLAADLHATV